MPDSCRPPPGTKRGTFHWLRCGDTTEPFEWHGRDWLRFAVPYTFLPKELASSGWRYVGPCKPPEREDA